MINRMSDIETKFPQDANELQPKVDLDFDFTLNSDNIFKEIKKLNYKQLKVPNAPAFLAEECVQDPKNGTIILSWQQKMSTKTSVQGYVLEIDDGTQEGHFKVRIWSLWSHFLSIFESKLFSNFF